MKFNILDEARTKLLPYFKKLPQDFYLTGGTALALQLGHRESVDFDFFTPNKFDTQEIYEYLVENAFVGVDVKIIQEKENTLDLIVDKQVKVSFLRYRYKPFYDLIETEYFKVADMRDIGATKLVAIRQRATQKDYYDLYFLLKKFSLRELFLIAENKYPNFDAIVSCKALTYYKDCDTNTPVLISEKVSFKKVQKFLTQEANSLFRQIEAE